MKKITIISFYIFVLTYIGISQLIAADIRLAVLKYGTVNWELNVIKKHNLDTKYVTNKYSIGTDVISILAETQADGCTYYDVMETIDNFQWQMANVKGVQSTLSLPQISKIVNGLLSEGNLKWKMLPKDEQVLVQSISRIETSTGLLNSDCSVMPVMVFLEDHKAETIERVVASVKEFQQSYLEKEKAVALSADKYCSASRMLEKSATITHDFEIVNLD